MNDDRRSAPELVAHRGYAARYPENTLPAIEAALQAGARYVEVDVQLTADGIPVLFHDRELRRTTGAPGTITATTGAGLAALRAGEPERFGKRFGDTPVPRLAELIALLRRRPAAHAFIEIKPESLDTFGLADTVDRILDRLAPVAPRAIPISYRADALRRVQARGLPVGWILAEYSAASLAAAAALRPDYLVCNHTKLPPGPAALPSGTWQWVLYEVTEPALALALAARGAAFIETMAVGELLRRPPWRTGGG